MNKFTVVEKPGFKLYLNEGGAVIGAGPEMQAHILVIDGFAFKDLNRNGSLDPYEDWRLPIEERIADLAAKMPVEDIAGLMLYSAHQQISHKQMGGAAQAEPDISRMSKEAVKMLHDMAAARYGGQNDTRVNVWDLSEEQKKFLTEDGVRHVLVAIIDDAVSAAKWNNNAQALVEGIGLGVPVNTSSDPRHTPAPIAEFDAGAGGDISKWPDHLGLAATFDPNMVKRFGEVASREYRAMGIATALSPQVDLATDPRWWRFSGTFGEGIKLSTDMARAYCDGFQESSEEKALPKEAEAPGWGYESVNAMAKHWPGGGSGEAGRDAHFGYGKYAVYPAGKQAEHLKPFTEGAFKLEGKTKEASAIMPYYTVSWNYDADADNVGNNFSHHIIMDLLRNKYHYEGVVCTDWGVTHDEGPMEMMLGGKCWGVEKLSVAERHLMILEAGGDQFGGNNDKGPVLEAYKLGVDKYGEAAMRKRFEQSAGRLLRNIFRVGLFENPYLDPEETKETAACAAFTKAGFEAQLKSIVLLKNASEQGKAALPLKPKTKVYIPRRHINEGINFVGFPTAARDIEPVKAALVNQFFEVVDTPEAAEAALCFIESPQSVGYTPDEGYIPISLQYRPYKADAAREKNIAGRESDTGGANRTYRGKTNKTFNEPDLDLVLNTRKAMGTKPVIVIAHANNPFVPAEFEAAADAVLMEFSVEPSALFEIISGKTEPSALLPFQMPASMETVEKQAEDGSYDMEAYKDSTGNTWDFAYGLNWQGIIQDERVRRYRGH
ncbi:MAG: glycoside hydrolase family 3 C-terminal domain-containing protein [Spirochaetaceae bacterium]|jgi:beta-glucosidase|nr:glycoside hydrolase family 3 C-terminal domain-containing protein [Spirochaetaceae bacterium]